MCSPFPENILNKKIYIWFCIKLGFPGSSKGKESVCNAGDLGSIPGLGRSPGKGNGNPLQLAQRIPWTEEPGRLQPMESQRVRHN